MELDMTEYSAVPFVEKGRSVNGWDCWGLVYVIYRDLRGIKLPRYTEDYDYTSPENEKERGRLIEKERLSWVEVDRPEPWDVVVLRLKNQPMHVGIYIGNGKMIHCMYGVGTTVEVLNSYCWRNRIVGYYRYA